jgi:hypothetical protein
MRRLVKAANGEMVAASKEYCAYVKHPEKSLKFLDRQRDAIRKNCSALDKVK